MNTGRHKMRKSRLKLEDTGYYHCMSRIIEQRFIMGDREKEYFVQLMRKLAAFSGLHILTYCVMSNHFHILIQEPHPQKVSDRLLLQRLQAIYPEQKVAGIAQQLAALRQENKHEAAEQLKATYTYRMHDISEYFKALKQGFSQWYNKRNNRRGPLWDQRFKSCLVEGSGNALATIAAYIDLNPIRAGIVTDPSQYRHCGYAEAMAGRITSREGIRSIWLGVGTEASWERVSRQYRKLLFLQGEKRTARAGHKARIGFSAEAVQAVLDQDGALSMEELLRCRVRYFSDGVAIGSRTFVEDVFCASRDWFGEQRKAGARPIRYTKGIGLVCMRDLRETPVSLSAA